MQVSFLNAFGRRPLDRGSLILNALSLLPFNHRKAQAQGYFADEAYSLTPDGYVRADCAACEREIIVTMAEDERGAYPEPLDERVNVVRGEYLECAGCAAIEEFAVAA